MYRHHPPSIDTQQNPQELDKQTAFHEAGHAVAILRNKRKNLPPINFEIHIIPPYDQTQHLSAKVVGGLFLQELAEGAFDKLAALDPDYQQVYEADIVNLLVGPIAEAKYVAIRDDEIFNRNLLTIQALRHYGGHSDIQHAIYRLNAFIVDPVQRETKIQALYHEAYSFIEETSNWNCILNLAHFILESDQSKIRSEDIIALFDH